MTSQNQPDQASTLISTAKTLQRRFGWLNPLCAVCGLLTSVWLLYLMYDRGGIMWTLLWFFLLSVAYKFGPAPMFALAASIVCFWAGSVGVWLPIFAYAIAALSLLVSLRLSKIAKSLTGR